MIPYAKFHDDQLEWAHNKSKSKAAADTRRSQYNGIRWNRTATQVNNHFARRHTILGTHCILHVYETRIKLKRTENMWSDELSYLFASIYGPWDHLLNSSFVFFFLYLWVRARSLARTMYHFCQFCNATFVCLCAFCLGFIHENDKRQQKITCANTINDLSFRHFGEEQCKQFDCFRFIYWPYCDLGTNNEIQTTLVYVV